MTDAASGTMSLDDALRARRSVRGFLPREIPETLLYEIFHLAQLAPSNCNTQPWLPHVASGATLAKLRGALLAAGEADTPPNPDVTMEMSAYQGVYRTRQVDAAMQLYGAMGVDRHDKTGRREAYLRNLVFFGAPHAVFLFLPRPLDIREAVDIGMYAQTLMLLLTARGLASCAQGALGLYPDIVREHLGVEAGNRLLLGISFGYEDTDIAANAARTGREELHQAVRFHR